MRWFFRRATSKPDHESPTRPGKPQALAFDAGGLDAAARDGYVPRRGVLPWFDPLSLTVASDLAQRPALNLVLPRIAMTSMSGGPNTALNLAGRLAARGLSVRLISSDAVDPDPAPIWAHVRALAEIDGPMPAMELIDASDRAKPVAIGANDVFLATAWWTAQMTKYALRLTRAKRFVYLIQDYEPLIHPASTQMALAEETYGLDYLPLVNTRLLHEFLCSRSIGRFAEPAFAADAAVFEPAVDRAQFFPAPPRTGPRKRRLLFYARPFSATRNLFELGVAALQKLVLERRVDPRAWEFVAMGDAFEDIPLSDDARLVCAPWLDLAGYARQMRESDVLLSLMMSPHPSYPPLEMAACGGTVVTTCYANKTAERLAAISPGIIGVPATVEAVCDGLARAMAAPLRQTTADIGLPRTWGESLAPILPRVYDTIVTLQAGRS